jgi:hypothetical protein
MDLMGIGWGVTDWINLAKDRNQWWVLLKRILELRIS